MGEKGEAQRPINVRMPLRTSGRLQHDSPRTSPFFGGCGEPPHCINKFENCAMAVEFLMKDINDLEPADSAVTTLQDAYERAKEALADAQARLNEARQDAERRERAAAEAGA